MEFPSRAEHAAPLLARPLTGAAALLVFPPTRNLPSAGTASESTRRRRRAICCRPVWQWTEGNVGKLGEGGRQGPVKSFSCPPRALFFSLSSANRCFERQVKLRALPVVFNPPVLSARDLFSARALHNVVFFAHFLS